MTIGGTSADMISTGTRISPRYTSATAVPRRIRRWRKLTGPESAIAMKPAMKIHVSGLRSRYTRYSASTHTSTVMTTRRIARVDSHWVGEGATAGALTPGGFAPRPRVPARTAAGGR